jgi:hypothetical protein
MAFADPPSNIDAWSCWIVDEDEDDDDDDDDASEELSAAPRWVTTVSVLFCSLKYALGI